MPQRAHLRAEWWGLVREYREEKQRKFRYICLRDKNLRACIHPKVLIYKSMSTWGDATRDYRYRCKQLLSTRALDNAGPGCTFTLLSGETSSMLHSQSCGFWPAYRKSNGRADKSPRLYRADRYSRFSPLLFHVTLIAQCAGKCVHHRRCIPSSRIAEVCEGIWSLSQRCYGKFCKEIIAERCTCCPKNSNEYNCILAPFLLI